MRFRAPWKLVLVAVAALCIGGWTSYAQRESRTPKRTVWEYRVENNGLSQEQLNELGSEGWELVAVSISNGQAYHYLKRVK